MTAAPIEKLLYKPEEAAKALGIGRSKIYALMASGQLESVLLGGSRRIPLDAMHAFIEQLRGSPSEEAGTIVASPNAAFTT
ncbi:MAG TPA: helix-turn-helix domain-containing protein [Acidimicrobiales bacterium]|nr:helix-turn-helix domain-containing protein [Acidimicrobiales bacterium]